MAKWLELAANLTAPFTALRPWTSWSSWIHWLPSQAVSNVAFNVTADVSIGPWCYARGSSYRSGPVCTSQSHPLLMVVGGWSPLGRLVESLWRFWWLWMPGRRQLRRCTICSPLYQIQGSYALPWFDTTCPCTRHTLYDAVRQALLWGSAVTKDQTSAYTAAQEGVLVSHLPRVGWFHASKVDQSGLWGPCLSLSLVLSLSLYLYNSLFAFIYLYVQVYVYMLYISLHVYVEICCMHIFEYKQHNILI